MADKQAASAMIRVPTPLIDAVKELSRLHRQGKTQQLLQALGEVIAAIDSSTESSIVTIDSDVISDLIARVERLEAGMIQPASTQQATPQKRARQTIAPTADEATADGWMNQQEVAALVGIHKSTIASKRQSVSEAEFLAWLDSKSPHRWEFDRSLGKSGMYRAIAPPAN